MFPCRSPIGNILAVVSCLLCSKWWWPNVLHNHHNSLFLYVGADDLYLEGYIHKDNLPGSLQDPRFIPNLPLGTETNRLSDGISSTDPFDTVSPNFPLYDGPLQSGGERYKYYLDYVESAAEQGISLRGSGDSVIEDARFSILRKANYTNLPHPTRNFTVYASVKWNPSGFAIQAGERYAVFVPGIAQGFNRQYWVDGNIRVNAAGYVSYYDAMSNCYAAVGRCRSYLKKKKRYALANWMALVCSVGLYVRPMGAVQLGNEAETNWLPLDESRLQETMFMVGDYVEFTAIHSGELICFANDAHNLYWNNDGSIQVTAVRMNWPPSKESYYQELYRPACDSAIAAYANGGVNVLNPMMKCNPRGGGDGWTEQDASNETFYSYTSGGPEYLSYVPKGIVL